MLFISICPFFLPFLASAFPRRVPSSPRSFFAAPFLRRALSSLRPSLPAPLPRCPLLLILLNAPAKILNIDQIRNQHLIFV